MAGTISEKNVRDFDFVLFSRKAVNEIDGKTRKEFGTKLFKVCFILEEQNKEMAQALVEDLMAKRKGFRDPPLVTIEEAFSIQNGLNSGVEF